MATSDKKKLAGYDPLAWLAEENESFVLEDLTEPPDSDQEDKQISENEIAIDHESLGPDQVVHESFELDNVSEVAVFVQDEQLKKESEIAIDDEAVSPSETETGNEILETEGSEINMNTIAISPEEDVSDLAVSEDVIDSTITLDANLTIQHVVKLHEQLKNAYGVHSAIQINASHVSSIDTATIQLLVALKKDAIKQSKTVAFAEPSQRFIESLELLGLLEVLEIEV
jgi:anti-anti-sigma regulatory factor